MRFLFALLILITAAPAFAQTVAPTRYNYFDYNRSWFADPQYKAIVKKAYLMPSDYPFSSLRRLYMQSSHYAPLSANVGNQLVSAAQRLQGAQGEEMYKALQEANKIIRDHFGNIAIVTLAGMISKQEPRLGSPEFYNWLRAGLMQDVLVSGDGATPDGAYDVITIEEETALLRALKLKILSLETVKDDSAYYNMYKVTDPKGGERTLFINATYPLSKQQKNAENIERPLAIFRQ